MASAATLWQRALSQLAFKALITGAERLVSILLCACRAGSQGMLSSVMLELKQAETSGVVVQVRPALPLAPLQLGFLAGQWMGPSARQWMGNLIWAAPSA